VHVILSLLTFFPGKMGGSETYVRGLLRGFSNTEFQRLTILANRHAESEMEGWSVRYAHRYWPGQSRATRVLAMNVGRVAPLIDGGQPDLVTPCGVFARLAAPRAAADVFSR
jgi:hypothetical protein